MGPGNEAEVGCGSSSLGPYARTIAKVTGLPFSL
jgi:hypothetical protein